jgi:predicted TIM-barrel fold metal-dependent hydrolase
MFWGMPGVFDGASGKYERRRELEVVDRIERYVEIIKEVHQEHTTYDVHMHPFEVFFDPLEYKENPDVKGLFSVGGVRYLKPTPEGLIISSAKAGGDFLQALDSRVLRYILRRKYSHTGPFVFGSLFDIAEIDKGLLLPIARGNDGVDAQMDLISRMYSNDKRFCLAGCIPASIQNEEILRCIRTQIDKYDIVAIKAHPNLSGVDLKGAAGKERIECIVDACSALDLPLIMHVGKSSVIKGNASRFAEIANFKDMKFKASVPVVMAHGGAYGIPPGEIGEVVIPVLRELLDANENVCIDVSGLQCESMCQLLASIDVERILFGSDALYCDPFVMEICLLNALQSVHPKIEESYCKIISENIEKRAFRWK